MTNGLRKALKRVLRGLKVRGYRMVLYLLNRKVTAIALIGEPSRAEVRSHWHSREDTRQRQTRLRFRSLWRSLRLLLYRSG